MCDFNFDDYDDQIRHRFAAWVASTAASVKGFRFKVQRGRQMIEDSKLKQDLLAGWDAALLNSSDDFDEWHRKKRYEICRISKKYREKENDNFPEFTHGIAAKLINVYMKVLFLGSVQDCMQEKNRKKQKWIHPPVDDPLFRKIAHDIESIRVYAGGHDVEFLQSYPSRFNDGHAPTPWTKLESEQYEKIIDAFRHITNGDGLWKIEKYWPGHR